MCVFIIMSKGADTDAGNATWTTWEELLLAFAVKRHGLKDWDTVAMELQNRHRSSLPSTLFTAQICKDRYRYLRQRFTNHLHHHRNNSSAAGAGPGGAGTDNNDFSSAVDSDAEDNNDVLGAAAAAGDDSESLPWLEELRKIRVAELQREVQRYDLSIESLQMKVKTMEEEREREKSSSENQNGALKQPDLDEETKETRSENDKKDADEGSPDEDPGKTVSAEDENRSFNESNSTGNRRGDLKTEPEPVEVKPDPHSKPVVEEDSCNDSSDRHEVEKVSRKREKERVDSDELRDSVSDSKEGTKESSDVQSSASLMTRKKRRKGEADGSGGGVGGNGGGEGATVVSPANALIKREGGVALKSEPLVGFLDKIRSHKHGSVFERRLESQKTEKYKNMIRQHVDLETVQARIDNGSYSSCSTRFYVDLLLLFNNAIVFFPKSSPESRAARELRQIVMKELKNSVAELSGDSLPMRPQPKPEPEKQPDSLLKSTAPIIVCRKRSSIQAKASSSVNKVEKQSEEKPVATTSKPPIRSPLSTSNEEESSMKLKMKEKPVTGVRSMRRSSKGRPNANASNSQSAPSSNQNPSSSSQQTGTADKGQAAKVDKKKAEEAATVKKRGAADFLKRIKKNDPSKGTLVEALKSSGENFKGAKKDQPTKKLDEKKEGPARRSGGGGGKHAKEDASPSKRSVGRPPKKGKETVVAGKRGRESGEGEGSSKRSKKRSRR